MSTDEVIKKMDFPTGERRQQIQKLCLDSMKVVPIGEEEGIQTGLDFYKHFFTNFPDLRVYFKGAEKYTAEDVQKSERFKKQGRRITLAVHLVVQSYNNPMVLHAYIREYINRHIQFKMEPILHRAFWDVWMGYLESRANGKPLDQETKDAWNELAEEYFYVCRQYLKSIGKPY
ncbi:globin domain-containing protein [Ditylenchus destructor]|nr:globin domain-containing protein [Ditylenchus destructor]